MKRREFVGAAILVPLDLSIASSTFAGLALSPTHKATLMFVKFGRGA